MHYDYEYIIALGVTNIKSYKHHGWD